MADSEIKEEMKQENMQEEEKEEVEIEAEQPTEQTEKESVSIDEGLTEEEYIDEQPISREELETKLKELEQKAEENYQKYLRTQADFDNFRRRTRKEKEDQLKYASLPLLEQLLPVLDNFERALLASKETQDAESLTKGIEMVFQQIMQVFQAEGVEVIPTVGTAFDPNIHQAVMQVESEEYDSGIIVEELQKGYKLKDKVIRPAMVKVSV